MVILLGRLMAAAAVRWLSWTHGILFGGNQPAATPTKEDHALHRERRYPAGPSSSSALRGSCPPPSSLRSSTVARGSVLFIDVSRGWLLNVPRRRGSICGYVAAPKRPVLPFCLLCAHKTPSSAEPLLLLNIIHDLGAASLVHFAKRVSPPSVVHFISRRHAYPSCDAGGAPGAQCILLGRALGE